MNQPMAFLIADCGSCITTVALFDTVNGAYRLIARATSPTTITPPWSNAWIGVQQAINNISEITGRPLLNENGGLIRPTQPSGAGVDFFAATVSAGQPLRVMVVGLLDDVSLASARRVVHSIYSQELDNFSLSDNRPEQAQIDSIVSKEPDLIFVAGGTDGGANERLLKLVNTIDTAGSLMAGSRKPQIVYAGNINLREVVTAVLGRSLNVQVAENVRPTLETENLSDGMRLVGELYEDGKMTAIPGIQDVLDLCEYPAMPTARAFGGIMEYFAALYKGRVVGLDLGSNQVTLIVAEPEQTRFLVRTDLGMGKPLAHLLEKIDLESLVNDLPVAIDPAGIRAFVRQKGIYPQTVPMTSDELYLEQALAREILRLVINEAAADWGWPNQQIPPFKLLVIRGSTLTNSPRVGQALLTVLDALQPVGVFPVVMDKYGVLPAIGLLAPHDPLAAVQILDGGALVDLGWVVAPAGRSPAGQKVMEVTMKSSAQGQLKIDAESGSLNMLILPPGESAELALDLDRRFDLGFGFGRGQKMTVHGGAVGLVFDGRGRPIQLPQDPNNRRNLRRQWLWDMGG